MNITAAQIAGGFAEPIAETSTAPNEDLGYKLYASPNPCVSSSMITYQFSAPGIKSKLIVSNAYGKIMQAIPLNSAQGSAIIHTENFIAGIYYYSIVSDNYKSRVEKLVVAR